MRSKGAAVLLASMPKAAVNEHGYAGVAEHNVRFAAALRKNLLMRAVPQSPRVKSTAKRQFASRICFRLRPHSRTYLGR
jgi:hypothetical protein